MIRLLIADDEKLEREALADMVSRRFEHEVVLEPVSYTHLTLPTILLV